MHYMTTLMMGDKVIWHGEYSVGIGFAERWAEKNPWKAERRTGWYKLPYGQRFRKDSKIWDKLRKVAAPHCAPDAYDVLCSLHSDAILSDQPFADWASDLGYDDDSIKAKAMWEACNDTRRTLMLNMGNAWDVFINQTCDGDEEPEAEDLHERFKQDILPMIVEQYGEHDGPAIREGFCNWIDMLQKDGEITEWLADNIDHPDLD
jgi:hypothetical protein